MRVLITGASGFIGASLTRALLFANADVHIFLRGQQSQKNLWRLEPILGDLIQHQVDLSDRDAVFRKVGAISPDVVFHLATYGAYPSQKDLRLMIDTNVVGTTNLVDACADQIGHFFNVSSSSEYGTKLHPMKETDLLEPNNPYGVTKTTATLYCMHKARECHLPVTTFRIFSAYGYYEEPTRLFPSIIVSLLKDVSPSLSTPASVRDFIFIDDVIGCFMKAMQVDRSKGEILNLGTGCQHSIADVVSAARTALHSSKDAVWGAVGRKQVEPNCWVADMSKTQALLDWKPTYTLETGAAKLVDWYREHLDLYGSI